MRSLPLPTYFKSRLPDGQIRRPDLWEEMGLALRLRKDFLMAKSRAAKRNLHTNKMGPIFD